MGGHLPRRKLLGLAAWWITVGGVTNLQASEIPEAVKTFAPSMKRLGTATFRVMGFALYDIRLFADTPFYPSQYAKVPLALELTYARSLSGQAIAERSLTEMQRTTSIDAGRQARWLAAMRAAFPDVQEGDRLVGLHDGKGAVQFWYNGQRRQALQDPEFARLFFGIWLAPSTSAPGLRERLLESVGG